MRPEQTFGTASGHAHLRQVEAPAHVETRQVPTAPAESWGSPQLRILRLVLALAVQAAMGGLLLAFATRDAGSGVPVGAVLGILWVALNAAIVSLYVGPESSQFRRRAAYLGATIVAALLAAAGALLTSHHSAWQILGVLGTLANLELVALVSRARRTAA
jgi:hypothetical protein